MKQIHLLVFLAYLVLIIVKPVLMENYALNVLMINIYQVMEVNV